MCCNVAAQIVHSTNYMFTQEQRENLSAFVNSNKTNVAFSIKRNTAQEEFEALLRAKHTDVTALDMGGVAVYTATVLVGWVDYENCCGFLELTE